MGKHGSFSSQGLGWRARVGLSKQALPEVGVDIVLRVRVKFVAMAARAIAIVFLRMYQNEYDHLHY